jgi:hypothetical protein
MTGRDRMIRKLERKVNSESEDVKWCEAKIDTAKINKIIYTASSQSV